MGYVTRPIPLSKGFDTIVTLTEAICDAAVARGFEFVMRYGLGLSADELEIATSRKLLVGILSYGRQADYSEATGQEDAKRLLDHLHGTLSLPTGFTLGLDLETPKGATHDELAAYEAGWAVDVVDAEDTSGVYVGAGLGMTSGQLYALASTRYYKSGSRVVDLAGDVAEPICGWTIIQAYPLDQPFAGIRIDFDFALHDFRDRQWWAIGGSP